MYELRGRDKGKSIQRREGSERVKRADEERNR